MENYTVPAAMIKAAQIFQANGDIRYYLNGIFLDKENGRVCGTNGHVLIICEDEKFKEIPHSMIVKIQGSIPASADHADLTVLDDYGGYMSFRKPGGSPVVKGGARLRIFYDVIEGKYPDVDKVLPQGKTKKIDKIGVNASYMGDIAKACRALGVGIEQVCMEFRGDSKSINVILPSVDNVKVVLMPCRV